MLPGRFRPGTRRLGTRNRDLPRGQLPEKPAGRFGRPLFQKMSYHDTPEAPLPKMEYTDSSPEPGKKHVYRIIEINSVGLESEPSEAAILP